MSARRRGIQSIEVGGRLLQALISAGQPMMLRDVARQAEVAAAQAHAYLTSFRKMGMVEQEASSGRYRLGPFALELCIARLRGSDSLRMAGDAIETFATEIRFTVALSVWGTYGPTVIQIKEGVDQLYTETRAGTVYSVSGTATGRVFAAHLPRPLVKSFIKAENAKGSKSRRVGKPLPLKVLEVELAQIRQRGFATIDPPPIRGVYALSAPVFDHVGQIQFAITVIGPGALMDTSKYSPVAEKLVDLTRRLSSQLGYEGQRPGSVGGLKSEFSVIAGECAARYRSRKMVTR